MRIMHYLYKMAWLFMTNRQRIQYMRKQGTVIGEDCSISRNVVFGTEPYLISMGNHVRLTSNVQFITHDGSMWVLRGLKVVSEDSNIFGKISIGDNVNIGWNAVIMPGVSIGNNCMIGTGSIVTKDIPDNMVVAGVPARIISSIDAYHAKHEQDFIQVGNRDFQQKKEYLLNLLK